MGYLLDRERVHRGEEAVVWIRFLPRLLAWLDAANEQGRVFSIERVADEILAGDDELVDWVRDGRRSMFLKPDAAVLASLTSLSRWATGGLYDASAVGTFLSAADSYIVAHTHAHGHIVVTHELVANSRKNVKVPNACVEMGVEYINTFEMLRREKARFVLP